jgi:hypothetical protein
VTLSRHNMGSTYGSAEIVNGSHGAYEASHNMSYYIGKTVAAPFDAVIADVTVQLKARGFGVLTISTYRRRSNLLADTLSCRSQVEQMHMLSSELNYLHDWART